MYSQYKAHVLPTDGYEASAKTRIHLCRNKRALPEEEIRSGSAFSYCRSKRNGLFV